MRVVYLCENVWASFVSPGGKAMDMYSSYRIAMDMLGMHCLGGGGVSGVYAARMANCCIPETQHQLSDTDRFCGDP